MFSGVGGLVAKIVMLSLLNGLTGWAIVVLFAQGRPVWAVATLIVLGVIDLVYLRPNKMLPAKFILPGSILLVAFLIIPIFFTINTSFQRYSTGHVLTKSEAIQTNFEQNRLAGDRFFLMTPARDTDGVLVLVLMDEITGETFLGRTSGLEALDEATVGLDDYGSLVPPPGFSPLAGAELFAADAELAEFVVPLQGGAEIRAEGVSTAYESVPGFTFDAARDALVATDTGIAYFDNGRGSFESLGGEEITVG